MVAKIETMRVLDANCVLLFRDTGDKMSKQVRKAVFPAGGLGTRFLPATKVIPKEMLALVDKPIIQYGVEEAIASGIEHIIIITGRGKGAMEDHFDHSFELDATLERRGKKELLAVSRSVASLARISYVRQKEPLGLGHAVLCAKELVGDEPFAVILPDDVIDADPPCLKQMIDVFDERGGSVLATMTIEGPASARMACWPVRRTRTTRASITAPAWWRSRSLRMHLQSRPSSAGMCLRRASSSYWRRPLRVRAARSNSPMGSGTAQGREGLRLHLRGQTLRCRR